MPERNSGGRFMPGIDDDDVMEFIRATDRPFSTTSRVADQFDIDQSTAYRRLQGLADDGRLNKDKVSANAVVWWIPDTGKMEHISRRHADDYYGENPDWADDLPDIGEGA
jgi:predicted transcriptional regulator